VISDGLALPMMAALGLIFGSFAGAASWRLPRQITLFSRSACPHCSGLLAPRDLVPVLSWLWQKGRCRRCGKPISSRYAAIELLTALLFVLSWRASDGDQALAVVLAGVSTLSMIIIAADLEERIIPNAALWPLLALGLIWHWLLGDGYLDGIITGLLLLGLTAALQWGYRHLRGFDGIGGGDVKFLGVAGFFLGLSGAAGFLVEAGVLGIAFGLIWRMAGKGAAFPFAPALVVVFLGGLMWPPLLTLPLEALR
jgi:prepilin signal peptidase PulO-like enzyme (type II secretory pathway)